MLDQETKISLGIISLTDLYTILEKTAKETNSSLELIYEKIFRYSPGKTAYAALRNATGSITRADLELAIKVLHAGYSLPGTNWTENSFYSIELSEPYGWKSGIPSDDDKSRLADYRSKVADVLNRILYEMMIEEKKVIDFNPD